MYHALIRDGIRDKKLKLVNALKCKSHWRVMNCKNILRWKILYFSLIDTRKLSYVISLSSGWYVLLLALSYIIYIYIGLKDCTIYELSSFLSLINVLGIECRQIIVVQGWPSQRKSHKAGTAILTHITLRKFGKRKKGILVWFSDYLEKSGRNHGRPPQIFCYGEWVFTRRT